jgi:hypothetical protein
MACSFTAARRTHALPSGRYEWRLTVDGLHAADRPHQHFDVPTDGDGVVEVEAPFFSDVRRVNLRTAPKDFPDDDIRTLVFAEESRLDGKPAADWLEASDVTPQRRALVLNILAKLRCVPSPDAPLIRKVEAILGAQNDRVYMRMSPTLIDEFGSLVDGDFFRREHGRLAPIHQRLLSWVRMRVDPPEPEVPFKLTSFRQAATFTSLQVVLASIDRKKLKKNDPPPPPTGCYADLDIDVGGSLTDIVGLVAHVGELLNGSMTDHVGLHDRLAKDGNLSPFLYYTVEAGV